MALARPFDDDGDEAGAAQPEQRLRQGGWSAEAPPGRAEPAELRTRLEYYEALRVADSRPVRAEDNHRAAADTRAERSGWDSVDTASRPPLDEVRVSPERTAHILDANSTAARPPHPVANPPHPSLPPR